MTDRILTPEQFRDICKLLVGERVAMRRLVKLVKLGLVDLFDGDYPYVTVQGKNAFLQFVREGVLAAEAADWPPRALAEKRR